MSQLDCDFAARNQQPCSALFVNSSLLLPDSQKVEVEVESKENCQRRLFPLVCCHHPRGIPCPNSFRCKRIDRLGIIIPAAPCDKMKPTKCPRKLARFTRDDGYRAASALRYRYINQTLGRFWNGLVSLIQMKCMFNGARNFVLFKFVSVLCIYEAVCRLAVPTPVTSDNNGPWQDAVALT